MHGIVLHVCCQYNCIKRRKSWYSVPIIAYSSIHRCNINWFILLFYSPRLTSINTIISAKNSQKTLNCAYFNPFVSSIIVHFFYATEPNRENLPTFSHKKNLWNTWICLNLVWFRCTEVNIWNVLVVYLNKLIVLILRSKKKLQSFFVNNIIRRKFCTIFTYETSTLSIWSLKKTDTSIQFRDLHHARRETIIQMQ